MTCRSPSIAASGPHASRTATGGLPAPTRTRAAPRTAGSRVCTRGSVAWRPSSTSHSLPRRGSICWSGGAAWKYFPGHRLGDLRDGLTERGATTPPSSRLRAAQKRERGPNPPGFFGSTASTTLGVSTPTGLGSPGPPSARSYTRGMRVKGPGGDPAEARSPKTWRVLSSRGGPRRGRCRGAPIPPAPGGHRRRGRRR